MTNRILVSPPDYDDIGAVLRDFGRGYEFDTRDWTDLCRPSLLRQYDVVYLNCSQEFQDSEYLLSLTPALREFVEEGGTLYASD